MIRNVTKPFLDIDMFVHLRTALRPEGSLPLARENCLLAVADARLAAAGPRLWSVWAQGAAGPPNGYYVHSVGQFGGLRLGGVKPGAAAPAQGTNSCVWDPITNMPPSNSETWF